MGNCLVTGNRAGRGAAVYNADESMAALRNCTISGNAATAGPESGGAVFNDTLSRTLVTNCILVENRPDEIVDRCPASKVSYSVIEGGLEGLGVVRVTVADPKFVAPGRWDDAGTPEDQADDVWVGPQQTDQGGDYHLQPGSPCIDAAHGDEALPLDIEDSSRSDDPGTRDTGIGDPTYVDIGAYEFQGRTGRSGGCAPGRGAHLAMTLWLLFAAALGRSRPAVRG